MKVIANLGKLSNGQDALVIKDGNRQEYVLCRNYNSTAPEGSQWDWGHYFSSFASFAHAVSEIENG